MAKILDNSYIYNLGLKFEHIAKDAVDRSAIIWDTDFCVTFGGLNTLSNQIANYLLGLNMRKNEVIAIQNNKSVYGFATMVACIKIGVIYTNFDYTNPAERIRKIFETAKPSMVFADEQDDTVANICESVRIKYTVITEVLSEIDSMPSEVDYDVIRGVTRSDPAYIMFTSGSTGIPKGVLISQGSLLDFISWGKQTYNLNDTDILTNVNPIYFDNSVFDFYCSVFNGIPMLAVPKNIVDKPAEMLKLIDEVGCTLWFSVPSMLIYLTNLRLLSKKSFSTIRIIAFGGEGYPKELLRKLYALYGDRADFYNVYGPTEGTCICSAYHIEDFDIKAEGLAPLGSIAHNFNFLVLDEDNVPSKIGELCIIGSQLALGYYNDEKRTNKSFVRNPLQNKYYERMYRTGDLVGIVDGKLFFKGRIDNQIKHMGYRIELEEIENALIKIDGVKQCAVVHTISKNNLSRLIAYVATEKLDDDSFIKNELKKHLPQYMIPNSILFLDELPKNANGKVDRNRLGILINEWSDGERRILG